MSEAIEVIMNAATKNAVEKLFCWRVRASRCCIARAPSRPISLAAQREASPPPLHLCGAGRPRRPMRATGRQAAAVRRHQHQRRATVAPAPTRTDPRLHRAAEARRVLPPKDLAAPASARLAFPQRARAAPLRSPSSARRLCAHCGRRRRPGTGRRRAARAARPTTSVGGGLRSPGRQRADQKGRTFGPSK